MSFRVVSIEPKEHRLGLSLKKEVEKVDEVAKVDEAEKPKELVTE